MKPSYSTLDRFQYTIWILFAILIVLLISNITGNQLYVFFAKTDNLFADFFNVQRYIAENDPYHNEINGLGEKAYLPLSYLIMKIFSLSVDYKVLSLGDCWHSTSAMMSCIIFISVSVIMFFHSLSLLFDKLESKMLATICFSGIFLFTIERANLIIITAALIVYFLALKDSNSKILKNTSLVCLCIAATIKVYPAIFGFLLLKEKRYRDIFLCVITTTILIILPFFCFKNGLSDFSQMMSNVAISSESYGPRGLFPRFGIPSTIYLFLAVLHHPEPLTSYILSAGKILTILLSIASFVLAYFSKNKWNTLMLLTLVLLMFPVNSALYCGMYMIPVIYIYIKDDTINKNWLFIIGFIVFLCPLQIVLKGMSVNYLLSNCALILMWLYLIYIETINLIESRKKINE